jgi:DNA repair exonuclease SbcCD ATPase subunit
MLVNESKLQGVNTKELFARMLGEVPWASLRIFVQANAPLLKLATVGGHRIEPKHRDRIDKLVLREAEKASFSQATTNGIFAAWYPVHEDLHKRIEDYFHSDEYKQFRQENNLGEDEYVLPDPKFDEFFTIDHLQEWRILLCFSPLKFSDTQADRILDDSQGNSRLLSRIKELEEKVAALEKRDQQLVGEAERLREGQQQAQTEAQDSRKALRQARTEADALTVRIDRAQADGRRLKEQLDTVLAAQQTVEQDLRQKLGAECSRLQKDVERLQQQLASWQSKYEEQRLQNKDLDVAIHDARREATRQQDVAAQASANARHLTGFADLILQRIDWPKVGASMKLTPRLRIQFNSLIRKLSYEQDRSLTVEGTLAEFWESLLAPERDLIKNIAQSNSLEVMTGNVEDYWLGLTDSFGDVQISLEARSVILKMLHEIFYQVIEMEDLREPIIPQPKGKP